MSIEGKIKTLFADKEKTKALFPRTKISAVSDDDGTGLDALIIDMVYSGEVIGNVATTSLNADTLGGRPAEEYATQSFVSSKIDDKVNNIILTINNDGVLMLSI